MTGFAITPDTCTLCDLHHYLPEVIRRDAHCMYLRSPALQKALPEAVRAVRKCGLAPLIPHTLHDRPGSAGCGLHYRAVDFEIAQRGPAAGVPFTTAACHEEARARALLSAGIGCVFVSPVFHPRSKPGFLGPLFPRGGVLRLIAEFGDRIALLGGMTQKRLRALERQAGRTCAVAGIDMYFHGIPTSDTAKNF